MPRKENGGSSFFCFLHDSIDLVILGGHTRSRPGRERLLAFAYSPQDEDAAS